jgi:hypothetical protein
VGKNDQSYFLQRAAEEQAASRRASCAAAAQVHRELAIRYSLKAIFPEPEACADAVLGAPKLAVDHSATAPPRPRRARG